MKSINPVVEQETTINIFPRAISGKAEVYTCIPYMVQRLLKLYEECPEEVTIRKANESVFATVPREWIKIQPKRKSNLTEEQKRANAERLAAFRESRKGESKS